jgi:hypothetical protein
MRFLPLCVFFLSLLNPSPIFPSSLPSTTVSHVTDVQPSRSLIPYSEVSAGTPLPLKAPAPLTAAPTPSSRQQQQHLQHQHHLSSSSSHFHLEALGSLGITITGKSFGDQLGYSVAIGGDVNADTYGDMIIGAPSYNSDSGQVYLVYGGLSLSSILLSSSFSSTQGITISAPGTGYALGMSVDVGGDVNGDGKNDFMIGAPYYSTNTGIAYVLYGSASLPTSFALSSLTSTQGISITGPSTNYYAGYSVSLGADIIPDGKTDPLFGGYGYSSNTGRAWYIYGSSSLTNVAISSLSSGQRLTGGCLYSCSLPFVLFTCNSCVFYLSFVSFFLFCSIPYLFFHKAVDLVIRMHMLLLLVVM